MPERTPDEIRRSVAVTRQELTYSLTDLRNKVKELTDYRRQINERSPGVIIGAGIAGFVIGGGIAATVGLFRRG